MEEKIFRLAKPKRKGLLPILFSRITIVVLLLVLQILIFVGLYGFLNEYFRLFSAAVTLFTYVMGIYLFCSTIDATSKLTWLLLLATFPVPTAFLLFYVRANQRHGKVTERVLEQIRATQQAIPQDARVTEKLERDGGGVDSLAHYLGESGCYPVYDRTEVKFFPLGEYKFAALLEELKKAEKFIFIEYFIIGEGYMWGEILKILIEKAAAGVDVRVMYDGMCELTYLPSNYPELLAKYGIKAKAFSRFLPIVSSHYNNRDHRKILVIDGRVAFNGGVNLADEYINYIHPFGHWKDTAVMLKGDAVRSFTLMFLQMWNTWEEQPEYEPFLSVSVCEPEHPSGYVMPFGECPLDDYKAAESVYMDILNRANRYVHIMTPYLILDGEMETALKFAAQRGVDVRILLPGVPDKKFAYALAKSHYPSLLGAGVKIYEYTPGFVHAKIFVSDDCKAVVSTINLDYRSLYHHFECGTFLYQADCIADIEADYQATLAQCRAVTEETIREEKSLYKLVGPLIKAAAPLM